MADSTQQLEQRIEKLEQQISKQSGRRSIRLQSEKTLWGFPLYQIALGPSTDGSEHRGHAKAIFALGDIATGLVAVGGIARGVISIGGLACGILSIGGCAFGLAAVLGGVAVGGYAVGGVAIGLKALGGVTIAPGWSKAISAATTAR